MTRGRMFGFILFVAASLAFLAQSDAAETAFTYKVSYRNVTKDADDIWSGAALSARPTSTVTIYEYQLRTPSGQWLISQIWNADCSSATCPTRLVQIAPDGRKSILVDDMMRQIVPPDDPRFAGMLKSKVQADFAQHPFLLSSDGKTLINGDFSFQIAGGRK